jgi:hypothetical protein
MKGFQRALGRAVASKAEMHGFPLIVWSAGGLQVHRFGMPGIVGVLAFAGGALVSMAVVVAITCRGFACLLPERESSVRAFGAIHVISVFGSVIAGWAVAMVARGPAAFFLASLVTVFVFEMLLTLELLIAADRSAHTGEDDA